MWFQRFPTKFQHYLVIFSFFIQFRFSKAYCSSVERVCNPSFPNSHIHNSTLSHYWPTYFRKRPVCHFECFLFVFSSKNKQWKLQKNSFFAVCVFNKMTLYWQLIHRFSSGLMGFFLWFFSKLEINRLPFIGIITVIFPFFLK